MWQTIRQYPTALLWAIVIHVLVFIAIGVSFKASEPNISAVKAEKVIAAVAIDEAQVNAEINKLKLAEKRKAQQQKRLQDDARKAKKERRKEEQKIRAIKKEQQKQAQKLKKEQEKQAQIFKKQQQAEQKRLAALEKKRQEQERQQKEIELKQKEKEKELSLLEQKAKERQAKLEKEEKERADKIAREKKAAEDKRRADLEQKEIDKYTYLIKSQVENNWLYLESYKKGLVCIVHIKLLPSGEVIYAKTTQSSGDIAFDRSAEQAAFKASPLSVPKGDTDLFQREFRTLYLKFNPTY